jgi:hypothetical protein
MKTILSYLLLYAYATIMIKPAMPVIADAMAHLLNYKEHVSTVHKHNGSFHVHDEYKKAVNTNDDAATPSHKLSKKIDPAPEHFMTAAFLFVHRSARPLHVSLPMQLLLTRSLPGKLRPPIRILS